MPIKNDMSLLEAQAHTTRKEGAKRAAERSGTRNTNRSKKQGQGT